MKLSTVFIRLKAAAYKVFVIISCGLKSKLAYILIFLLYRKVQMTLSLPLAMFCRPNSSFAIDFLQHHVHIRHRRDYDKQKAVVEVKHAGNARVRERRERISKAWVTYVEVRLTIKGSLH